ncbi:MAG TPA: transglutaminase domain-containing protein [Polyangiaceae bacterium]|nr:transglutaminase domain-containing protein [Polyangiaceae bacterium]
MKASATREGRRKERDRTRRAGARMTGMAVGLVAAAIGLPAIVLAQPAGKSPAGKTPSPAATSAPAQKKDPGASAPSPQPPQQKKGQLIPRPTTTPARPGTRGEPQTPPLKPPSPPPQPLRWTGATPDQMIDFAVNRAKRGGEDAIAALLVVTELDERGSFGRARTGLRSISASNSAFADDARMLFLALNPEPVGAPWPGAQAISYDAPADPNGMVKAWSILGPFQDTGGGLDRREGPEAPGQSFSDTAARYAWGVYDVAWRRVLPTSSTARGVPLDLYIHPRQESCSYLASKVAIPESQGKGSRPILVHVAATGAVRLIWDGVDVAASEEVHPKLALDRLAARIEAKAGEHLVAVKVCSAATPDEGRVRVRFTDDKRKALAILSSSDLRGFKVPAAPAATAPDPKPARPAGGKATPAPPSGANQKVGPKEAAAKATAPQKANASKQANGASAASTTTAAPGPIARVPTSLEQALAIGEAPAADRALAASIVRTLGGADDARSPRAPGLLDRIARTPEISPDTLAMAGWVSPFGANRSGWLNLARSRATAENDRLTLAFAQRRIAASNLSSNLADWALSTSREEPLASAKDPEARLIRALVKKQLAGGGVLRGALDDLLAIADEQKNRTPLAVTAEVAEAARSLQPLVAHGALRRLAEARAESRGAAFVRSFKGGDGASLEIAAAQSLKHQTQALDLVQIGRDLYEAGRYAWAREAFYLATKLAPNRAPAFEWLATARNAAATYEKQDAQTAARERTLATAAVARARDLEPSDPALKSELSFRTSGGAKEAADRVKMRDEQYLPSPSVFLERGRKNPAKKGEISDRQLHWVRVVTYHPDKRVSQLMHYAREIGIEPRTEADLYERGIPVEGDTAELLFARVHRKDGTVVPAEEQGSGGSGPYIRWPALKTGDVVELAVRSWVSEPVGRRGGAPFYFVDYVGSVDTHPILYNEVVVESPAGSPLAIDVINGKADHETNDTKDGRLIRRFIWDNPPNVVEEPLSPELTEVLPVVVGSTFAGWHEFREWYKGAVAGFTEPDEQVRHLAAELTKGKKTREEKLKAIFDFVSDDIRYVNYVSGEWWLPNRPQQLLARRQGDCDDKAMLLITLLKSVGIEATEVLVQTRMHGKPSLLKSEKVAVPEFDHGIAYLPGKNGEPGMWLDATSPQSRLGPLPSMDARAVAMFVHEGPAKIIPTPPSSPADHGVDAEWTIKLLPSGAGELIAKERHTGDAAFWLRNYLGQADAQAQWVEQYLSAGWFPTIQVKPEVTFNGELPNGAALLGFQASSEGLARREGGELAVALSSSSTLTSQLAPLVKRTLPVSLPSALAPGHQTHTITITAPPGFAFAALPPNGEEQGGEFGFARVEFKKGADAGSVVVKRTIVFDMSLVPVDKYAAWRGWLQRVDGLSHRMVRLVPTGEGAAKDKAAAPGPR